MKEFEDTHKQKAILCSQTESFDTVKITKLPKRIYRINAIAVKIPVAFFHRNGKYIHILSMDENDHNKYPSCNEIKTEILNKYRHK